LVPPWHYAITAVQDLNATNKAMQMTQDRILISMRVANVCGNAACWAIATTTKSDNGALSTAKDALGWVVQGLTLRHPS
jgi:flagellin